MDEKGEEEWGETECVLNLLVNFLKKNPQQSLCV
jgi:hypothetical protein